MSDEHWSAVYDSAAPSRVQRACVRSASLSVSALPGDRHGALRAASWSASTARSPAPSAGRTAGSSWPDWSPAGMRGHHRAASAAVGSTTCTTSRSMRPSASQTTGNRRPQTIGRMVQRLMILDGVLGDRQLLVDESRSATSGATSTARGRPGFGRRSTRRSRSERRRRRPFATSRTSCPSASRSATLEPPRVPLSRDAAPPRRLPDVPAAPRRAVPQLHTWTVRLLVPRRFWKAAVLYKAALRDELWTPLNPNIGQRWRRTSASGRQDGRTHRRPVGSRTSLKAFRRQGMPRFASLYRAWRRQGDPILWQPLSRPACETTGSAAVGNARSNADRPVPAADRLDGPDDGPRGGPSEKPARLAPRFRRPVTILSSLVTP